MSDKIEDAKRWYLEKKPLYDAFAEKIDNIIWDILESEDISYYSLESRAKKVDSFVNKIKGGIGFDPKDMQDLAGVRIICYTNSDLDKISSIIKDVFEVDESRSSDRSKILGIDKVGYRSIHFVCKLTEERESLRDFIKFKGLYFEIQIRTILQHAWAEINHDNNYKFGGVLPRDLQRRFSLVAGLLEIADNEFDSLSINIEDYSKKVSKDTKEGNLNIFIDSTSLRAYLLEKFGDIPGIEPIFGPEDNMSTRIVKELKQVGIDTLQQLDKIIPFNFRDKIFKNPEFTQNFCGLIRNILIIHNADDYFKKAWENKWSFAATERKASIYQVYGINILDLCKKYGVDILEE